MGKIGRRRKYSHWKYTKHHPTGNTQTKSSPPVVPSYNVPIEYQFPLRHLPSAVLHQSSLYNYTQVFSVLSESNVLKNTWNAIKHALLSLFQLNLTGGKRLLWSFWPRNARSSKKSRLKQLSFIHLKKFR